ncbi:MAG: DNA polymerase IV [Desulfovibrionaceae bacterium]
MHIDMDAFFASVEILDNPELAGRPVAVGGLGERSVVCAASYEIRKYGVRSAMPGTTARRLCPQGIFLPPRMRRYAEVSRRVMAVLAGFSPLVEQASVDEAYLDATGMERLFGPPREMGRAIKDAVRAATGLTCSVGAAPVRFLAKIASDLEKPDGLTIIEPGDIPGLLARLPVEKIPGVGARAFEVLRSLGVRMAADVLRFSEEFWTARFGVWGETLYDRARGIGSSEVVPWTPPKSCSAEDTFPADTADRDELGRWLLAQAERVGEDLRRHDAAGRTVTVKIKYADFRLVTRSHTLRRATCDTRTIHEAALELLRKEHLLGPVRLIGVGVSNFSRGPEQLSLFPEEDPARRVGLDRAVDAVRRRFGRGAVTRGALLDGGPRRRRG